MQSIWPWWSGFAYKDRSAQISFLASLLQNYPMEDMSSQRRLKPEPMLSGLVWFCLTLLCLFACYLLPLTLTVPFPSVLNLFEILFFFLASVSNLSLFWALLFLSHLLKCKLPIHTLPLRPPDCFFNLHLVFLCSPLANSAVLLFLIGSELSISPFLRKIPLILSTKSSPSSWSYAFL